MYTYPYDNLVFVSQEEARAYLLPPNSRRLLMDKDRSVFYIKTTDALGQSTIDAYEFNKVPMAPSTPFATPSTQPASTPTTSLTTPAPDLSQYVTREELEKALEALKPKEVSDVKSTE